MIRLSNGEELEFLMASATRGFDGLGWKLKKPFEWFGGHDARRFVAVTKSFTLHPREGNTGGWKEWNLRNTLFPLTRKWVQENLPATHAARARLGLQSGKPNEVVGWLNAHGLPNPGFASFLFDYYPRIVRSGQRVIVSIQPTSVQEAALMAKHLRACKTLVAVEYNAFSPNFEEKVEALSETVVDIAWMLAQESGHPVILKFPRTHPYANIVPRTQGVIAAYTLNAVPWRYFADDLELASPLVKFGGGAVSGLVAQPFNWPAIPALASMTHVPVIGTNPWYYEDLPTIFSLGAKAVAFGSLSLLSPRLPTKFIERWRKEGLR